jgi:hypothetical protein
MTGSIFKMSLLTCTGFYGTEIKIQKRFKYVHPVVLTIISIQAKELREETGVNRTSKTRSVYPLLNLLRWAQEQASYIITGNYVYGNGFESRL